MISCTFGGKKGKKRKQTSNVKLFWYFERMCKLIKEEKLANKNWGSPSSFNSYLEKKPKNKLKHWSNRTNYWARARVTQSCSSTGSPSLYPVQFTEIVKVVRNKVKLLKMVHILFISCFNVFTMIFKKSPHHMYI